MIPLWGISRDSGRFSAERLDAGPRKLPKPVIAWSHNTINSQVFSKGDHEAWGAGPSKMHRAVETLRRYRLSMSQITTFERLNGSGVGVPTWLRFLEAGAWTKNNLI
jgi:hypothetical protein